ncbi:7183_t:CDS:2, partial [Entrophospora sp. SA101]
KTLALHLLPQDTSSSSESFYSLPSSSNDDINKLEEEAIQTIQNNNAWHDIIDVTSTSSSRFIPSLPSISIDEIKSFGSSPPLNIITDLSLKSHIVRLVKEKDFCKAIENNAMKFVWDFGNLLADSFECNNDLADLELSEFGYREFFLH